MSVIELTAVSIRSQMCRATVNRLCKLAASLMLVAFISACGGGDDDPVFSGLEGDGRPVGNPGGPMPDSSSAAEFEEQRIFEGNITEVVLVSGQSNALGADTTFDAGRDQPHERAFAYTSEGWQVADLHQVWDLNWHPRNDPATDPSNNFGFHFARKVAERRPQRVVGFILVTAPGEAIENWDYNSEFYLKIRNRVIAALNELPNKATIDGILWHQGESDWADSDYYSNKLSDLINNFRTESWFGEGRPFICGETVEAPVNRRLMQLNTDGDPRTACVESDGLSTILDRLHFSAEGLRILGTRYATKYIEMTESANN